MNDYTFFMESERDSDTLSFASPLTDGPKTYRYNVTTIILEDVAGPGRADYSIWDRDPNNAGHWDLSDDEPGIHELTYNEDDEPCQDCQDELAPYWDKLPELEHEDDCPTRDEDEGLDGWEGFYCCFALRDKEHEAHQLYRKEHEDETCTLSPDFALLDGGELACRAHVAEWFGARFLWIGNDYGAPNRERMLRDYFAARRRVADSDNPTVAALPSTNVLYRLAALQRARIDLDEAERTRRRRDDDIGGLRDDLSTETLEFWSGVSPQRIRAINAEHEATRREFWQRVADEHEAKAKADGTTLEHVWTPATFTGVVSCARCGLTLHEDDRRTECQSTKTTTEDT